MPLFTRDGMSILFIHVPKTGGTSIEQMFVNEGFEVSYLTTQSGRYRELWYRKCSAQHMHAPLLEATFRLDRISTIFTVVREPIARFRSEYLYRMRKKAEIHIDTETVGEWCRETLRAYYEDSYIYDNHIRPQADFLISGVQVYKLEEGLDRVICSLNAQLDLKLPLEFPQKADSKADIGIESTMVELSPETEKALKGFYAVDYRMFGYDPS